MALTIQQITDLFETSEVLLFITVLFVFNMTITGIELIVDFASHRSRKWQDTFANVAIYILREMLEKTFIGSVSIVCLLPFYYFSSLEIPMTWWTWVLGLLAADFTYYWMHRLEHEHRVLWALHSVHHSSKDYNLSVALRLSIVEGIIEWAFLVPMILIGFNPFQAVTCLVFVAQYQTWIHTDRIKRLGWLDKVFNTPSVHRVHHGSNRKYLDKNYGGVLIIWDRIFGTYQIEEEQPVYGLTKNIETNNPLKINFIEFHNIWIDVKKCSNWKDRFKIVFGRLTWRPAYFEQSLEPLRSEIPKDESKASRC